MYAKQKYNREFEESTHHSGDEYCNTKDEKYSGNDCLQIRL